jgi:hypothetical protein
MAELTTRQRNDLPDSAFAVITADGERKYPINDISHARNALARVSQHGSPSEKKQVRDAVYDRYPKLDPDNKKKDKLKEVFRKQS